MFIAFLRSNLQIMLAFLSKYKNFPQIVLKCSSNESVSVMM